MRVFDHIEFYNDFPDGVDEEYISNYRSLLESHLDELSPIRSSKEKTEKYFKQHIWPGAIGGDLPEFRSIRLYTWETGDGQTVRVNIERTQLIASLLDVLRDDTVSFSYIYNLLKYGCNYADPKTKKVDLKEARAHYHTNADICYAIEFDLDKVSGRIDEKATPDANIASLEQYLNQSRAAEGVSQDLKEQFEFAVELRLESLKKELSVFEKAKKTLMPDDPDASAKRSEVLLFYNFWGTRMLEFQDRARVLPEENGYKHAVLTQDSNSEMLVSKIIPLFRTLKKRNSPNADLEFTRTVELLGQLMLDFTKRALVCYHDDYAGFFNEGKAWMAETRKCIAEAYSRSLTVTESIPRNQWEDTSRHKNQLQQWCAGAFTLEMLTPVLCPHAKVKDTMPYNFWGDTYEAQKEEALQKFICDNEEEDMIDFASNVQHFSNTFADKYWAAKKLVDENKPNREGVEALCKMVTDLANDYIRRVQKDQPSDESLLRFAKEIWLWLTRLFVDLPLEEDMDKMFRHLRAHSRKEIVEDGSFLAQVAFRSYVCDSMARTFDKISKGFDRFITSASKQDDSIPVTAIAENAGKAGPAPKKVQPVEPPVSENITYNKSLTREQQEALHVFLHQKMDSEKDYHGFAAIYAAIELTYLKKPTFPQVSKEFGIPDSKEQNYSGFMGKRGKFAPSNRSEEHTDLIDGLKDEIKALPEFTTK